MISGGFQKEMQQWLERFFVGVLPQQVRTWVCFRGLRSMPSLLGFFTTLKAAFKVVDHALVDGVTALYRVALRILKANEEDLLQAANGTDEQGLRVPGIALTPCSPPSPHQARNLWYGCEPSRNDPSSGMWTIRSCSAYALLLMLSPPSP
jgi:hypothetical protein